MTTSAIQGGGRESVAVSIAAGNTDAIDPSEITPDDDDFVVATFFMASPGVLLEYGVIVTTKGTKGTGTLVGKLRAVDGDGNKLLPDLDVINWPANPVVNPEAGTPLAANSGSSPLVGLAAGTQVKILWKDISGVIGTGVRPGLHYLGQTTN
jgi:hypothetical protein